MHPHFFTSLKIAIAQRFVGSAIAGIIASDNGIGTLMLIASSNLNVSSVFFALFGQRTSADTQFFAPWRLVSHAGSVRESGLDYASRG